MVKSFPLGNTDNITLKYKVDRSLGRTDAYNGMHHQLPAFSQHQLTSYVDLLPGLPAQILDLQCQSQSSCRAPACLIEDPH